MPIIVGNNYYDNVTIINGNTVFYFFSELSNMPINNETALNCDFDDLYIIGAVNNLTISNFFVENIINTGAITESSAIINVA